MDAGSKPVKNLGWPLTIRNYWLISRNEDAVIFYAVPLLGFLIAYFSDQYEAGVIALLVAAIMTLDYSHLLLSGAPIFIRYQNKLINGFIMSLIFLGIPAASIFIWNLDQTIFRSLIVLFVIQHQIRQFFGWFKYSQRDGNHSLLSSHDIAFFYIISFIPFMLGYSELFNHDNRNFFFNNDASFITIPLDWARALHWIYLFAIPAYLIKEVFHIAKSKEVIASKYLILFSAWFCFGFCYTLAPLALYFLPHTFHHCYSYIRFNYNHISSNTNFGILKSPLFYFFLICVLGLIFQGFRLFDPYDLPILNKTYAPLIWSIPLIHYITDMFIWRKSYMKGIRK